MEENESQKIAAIIDDQNLQDYINLLLIGEGYEVKAFASQGEAISSLEKETVDLIITEFKTPNIDGLDICKILRKNIMYNLVPILFLIPDSEPLNAAKLIYAGADDYIKKSLIQDELFLKVKIILYRTERQHDINITTKLPGQTYLIKELGRKIDSKTFFAVSCLDLFKFKEFEYQYGYEKGNAVIKFTSNVISKALKDLGEPTDFIAQTLSNEFMFICSPERSERIVERIIQEFDGNVSSFYNEEDRMRRYSLLKNRKGQILKVPFLKVRIGIVVNTYFSFFSPIKIIQIVNEIKDSIFLNSDKSLFVKEEGRGYSI